MRMKVNLKQQRVCVCEREREHEANKSGQSAQEVKDRGQRPVQCLVNLCGGRQ